MATPTSSASTAKAVPSSALTFTDKPVTTKNSGSSTLLTSSMGRRTSGSGVPSLLGMVKPASSPPNTGCKPSDAVTQALPSVSARATGS